MNNSFLTYTYMADSGQRKLNLRKPAGSGWIGRKMDVRWGYGSPHEAEGDGCDEITTEKTGR